MANIILRFNEGDKHVNRGVASLRRICPKGIEVITEHFLNANRDRQELSKIISGENLYIHAHGRGIESKTDKCGGKTPIEMAQYLADNGLKSGVTIHIFSCFRNV